MLIEEFQAEEFLTEDTAAGSADAGSRITQTHGRTVGQQLLQRRPGCRRKDADARRLLRAARALRLHLRYASSSTRLDAVAVLVLSNGSEGDTHAGFHPHPAGAVGPRHGAYGAAGCAEQDQQGRLDPSLEAQSASAAYICHENCANTSPHTIACRGSGSLRPCKLAS
eukprot:COSAG02_NODE_6710_length_3407_cov_1.898730_5_plen_168_part_00